MIVHLIDGTYELFRHFYGMKRFAKEGEDQSFGAVIGVLNTVLQMIEGGATHIAVATDHVIESFRNDLWRGYKTSEGIDPLLHRQFHPLEEALVAMGVATFAMVELEADDGLASAAHLCAQNPEIYQISIWTPDKDLSQCVVENRVVQVDRRTNAIRNAEEVKKKFGVDPVHIPDYLALVGDSADGYPGMPGIGAKTAANLINRYGHIEEFPSDVLGDKRELALLFKDLATLRTDAPVFTDVDELKWRGPSSDFAAIAERIGANRVMTRAEKIAR